MNELETLRQQLIDETVRADRAEAERDWLIQQVVDTELPPTKAYAEHREQRRDFLLSMTRHAVTGGTK